MSLEEKVNELEKALIKVDERSKSNTKRLNEVDAEMKENNSLVTAIKELAIETKYMREDLNETIQRLSKLESKDADKWDKFKWLLVAGIVTLVLGFIALQIGLK
jgi:Flp pilus assembly protein TadB